MRDQTGANNPNWKGGISTNFYHYKKLQKQRYPDRVYAREQVRRAIKAGRLIKGACEFCPSTDVQAHHDDYSKPLKVRWMCRKHHNMYERGLIIQITAPVTVMAEAEK